MKKGIIYLVLFSSIIYGFAPEPGGANPALYTATNEAYKRGEVLKYRLHYGWMDAGEAVMQVKEEIKKIGSRSVFHVVGTGISKGTFDWFFKVRDRYETYIDEESLVPWLFIRRVEEGSYTLSQDYFFNHYKNKVDVGGGTLYDIPSNTQDMISSFYAARCIDFSNAKEGDIFTINSFVDKEIFELKIKYVGKETIKSDVGKIRCLKFSPVLQKGRIFKREEDLKVWISDDKNHIPIRAQADILFGSLKIDLSDYKELTNKMALED